MGIASLVLGIISAILGFVPLCNIFALIPALIGFILGVAEAIRNGKNGGPKGVAIAGIILNVIAFVITIGMYVAVYGIYSANENLILNSIVY
ncbi:MAG: hypothetical protein Q4D02_06510 [Clostridia bacterium]|nr:hypothetical protein [Clostridia bacterium]